MLDFDWLVHASHWITIVLSIILMLGAIIYLFMIWEFIICHPTFSLLHDSSNGAAIL